MYLNGPVLPCTDPEGSQVDGVTQYVDWAVSKKFGIMDINVPRNPSVRAFPLVADSVTLTQP